MREVREMGKTYNGERREAMVKPCPVCGLKVTWEIDSEGRIILFYKDRYHSCARDKKPKKKGVKK